MKQFLSWLLIFAYPGLLYAQHCLPDGITFYYQSEIDNFQANYPGCHSIDGNVRIDGNDVVDLSGLNVVDSISGDLVIQNNPVLESLSGLENLLYIRDDLEVKSNESLESLLGLSGLNDIGGNIRLYSNDHLVNLSGLQNLDTLNGGIDIQNNARLANLHGLDSLCYAAGLFGLAYNDSLVSLQHLGNLSAVGNMAIIGHSSLPSLTGLESLNKTGELLIMFNPELTSLDGLQGLDSISYGLELVDNESLVSLAGLENLEYLRGGISVEWNYELTSLSALEGLSDFGGNVEFRYNHSLTSLDGIGNFNAGGISRIVIISNSNLCDCDQASICTFLSDPSGSVSVYGNAPGCDGPHEIAESCGFSLSCLPYGSYYFQDQEDIDSFAVHYSNCAHLMGYSVIRGEDITNLEGLSIIESVNGALDICGNPNLATLEGLERLKTVAGNLALGYWECGGNDLLVNLEGLDSLLYVSGAFMIVQNHGLEDLRGLRSLESVGAEFGIYENNSLASLDGANSLSSVGSVRVAGNAILPDLRGLENLVNVGQAVEIIYNPTLESLSGIDNINPYFFEALWLRENGSLSECDVYSICEFLAHGGGTSEIIGNLPGCNSEEEILEACLVGIDEGDMPQVVFMAPNPARGVTAMELMLTGAGTAIITFSDIYGRQIIRMEEEFPSAGSYQMTMNVSSMPAGIYCYSLDFNGKRVGTGKLVVVQ